VAVAPAASQNVGVRLVGELDLLTRDSLHEALAALIAGDADVLVDLSAVTFIDVGCMSVITSARQSMTPGRRLLLRQPPAHVPRTLELLWPRLGSIEVVAR
jgi:anti-anti-sigma factor